MYVKLIQDTQNKYTNERLLTFEVNVNMFIWAEFLTHRLLSRNAQSNRAKPTAKILSEVHRDCAYPIYWGVNQAGMQSKEHLSYKKEKLAKIVWLLGSKTAIATSYLLNKLGVHKEIANRPLMPYQWQTAVITGTAESFDAFFNLRCDYQAQAEIRIPADEMRLQMLKSSPSKSWYHLPYATDDELIELHKGTLSIDKLKVLCTSRVARVSIAPFDGNPNYEKELSRYNLLKDSRHCSPFEHIATCMEVSRRSKSPKDFNSVSFLSYRNEVFKER